MLHSGPSHSYFYVHSALYLILIWRVCFHIRVILSPEKYLQDSRWYTLSSLCLQKLMWSQVCYKIYLVQSEKKTMEEIGESKPHPTQRYSEIPNVTSTDGHLESWLDPIDHQVKESTYVRERRVFLKSAPLTIKELCKRPSKLWEISSKEASLGQNQ